MKKEKLQLNNKHSTLVQKSDLLFSSNDSEIEITSFLLTNDFIIHDVDLRNSKSLFNKKKNNLLGQSFINLLDIQQMDISLLLKAFKKSSKSRFQCIKLEHPILKKWYCVMVTGLDGHTSISFTVTLISTNYSYQTLRTYINAIINNLPGAVYWKDLEGHYMGCNKFVAQMAGYEYPEQMLGKTDYDFCWSEFADAWRLLDNKVIKENLLIQREEKVKLANGDIRTELTFKSPLKNEHNEIVGIIGTSLDITERKEMEVMLHESQLAAESANIVKTNFIQNMQHDIRTPASSIYSVLDQLVENNQVPDCELLILLRNSAKQLFEICNEVIDFDRIERGDIPLVCKRINIRDIVNKIVELNQTAAYDRNLKLSFEVDESLPLVVKGDEHRLSRILVNLIGNALKFTQEGSISLSVHVIKENKKDYIIQFKLQDTGIGISLKNQETVYEKFNRLNPANRGTYKGSGLGLRIVKKYVDDMDGEINLESQSNKGTTFFIDIPFEKALLETIYDNQSCVAPTSSIEKEVIANNKVVNVATVPSKSQDKTCNTLLIEDNVLAMKVGETILKSLNCHVTNAVDVASALEALRREQFDLVVSDIGLPDGTGIDVIKAIRGDSKTLNFTTPFCALTANSDPDTIRKCKQAGFFEIMAKPIFADKLKTIINQCVLKTSESKKNILEKSIKFPLTFDIPKIKSELFELKNPLFDLASGLNAAGYKKEDLENHLQKLINLIDDKEVDIKQAVAMRNWPKVENLSLKIKESAVYCGVIKLLNAYYYFEFSCKDDSSPELLEALSEQFIKVMQETKQCLINWLQQKNKILTPSSNVSSIGGLGLDLPDTEAQLFQLEQYPLLDIEVSIKSFGCIKAVSETLQLMIDDIYNTKIEVEKAYTINDWDKVEKLAHKMKGGAMYLGTMRLKYACQYLERYRKAGNLTLLDKLYQQLLKVLDKTQDCIKAWFKSKR